MKPSTLRALLFLFALEAQAALSQTTTNPTRTPSRTAFSTSVVQATRFQPSPVKNTAAHSGYAAASASPNQDSGAIGTDSGSFHIGLGGLIAIIVVIVAVVVGGIVSVVLYTLAKRRNWQVRASIKRASRRLTGRRDTGPPRNEVDKRKRSGMVAGMKKPGPPYGPVYKNGTVVQVRDVEKGKQGGDVDSIALEKLKSQRK